MADPLMETGNPLLDAALQRSYSQHVTDANTANSNAQGYLQSALQPQNDLGKAFATALVGALPALIGGIAGGKRGLAAGAIGGQLGAETKLKKDEEDDKQRQFLNTLLYKGEVEKGQLAQKEAADTQERGITAVSQQALQDRRDTRQERSFAQQNDLADKRMGAMVSKMGEASDYKDENAYVRDTTSLRNEIEKNKPIQETQDRLHAAGEIADLVSNPNGVTKGALRIRLAAFNGAKGRINIPEINLAYPRSVKESVTSALNYATNDDNNPVPPKILKDIASYVVMAHKNLEGQLDNQLTAIEKRADTIAPHMHKTGKLKDALASHREQILSAGKLNSGILELASGGATAPKTADALMGDPNWVQEKLKLIRGQNAGQ